jgi:fatty-acyl-CoA synthase
MNPMPMFHTAGCGLVTLGALQTGGAQVMPPGFDSGLMLQLCEEERGSIMLSVPTMLIRMLDDASLPRRDTRTWRLALIGGAGTRTPCCSTRARTEGRHWVRPD